MQVIDLDTTTIHRTRAAFLWTSLLHTPFWAMYNLLLFIMYKDLHATPLQVTLFITLKPLVALLSMYWSSHVNKRRDRLRANVMWAGILGNIPFFFFPFVNNAWFMIFASAFYMTLSRGAIPAWLEILKLNLPEAVVKKTVSRGSMISYVGGGFLSIAIGLLMDDLPGIWRWMFPCSALMSVCAAFLQYRLKIPIEPIHETIKTIKESLSHRIVKPWKDSFMLVRTKKDFSKFLFGFMLGGFGLIIVQPALPTFFIDVLRLSYAELSTAFTFCKGIAFALTSPLWTRWLHKVNIFKFSSIVTLLASLFPILLISAQFHIVCVYVAYLIYGVMQAGSELSWHLSGPIFSRKEDSSTYSSVNVGLVGIRGCIAPPIGSLLLALFSPTLILICGCVLSLIASWCMAVYNREPQAMLKDSAASS